ncbi:MAG: OmpW family protein [Gammaproteobacteria bacterium]|nr:OmpW family protein [Gammaproteobacteria bacterium]
MKTSRAQHAFLAMAACGLASAAAGAGDWLFRAGAHNVEPKSNNHSVVNVDGAPSLTVSATYFMTPNLAVEVLGAVPFKHDINLNSNGAEVASTTHLPPTVTLQYHFAPDAARFRPYVGAGLNYTIFFDEKTKGALAGTKLSLDESFGPAVELGLDIALNDAWAINLNARWFDIDTDARLDGASLGTVEIDPYAIGLMVTRKVSFGK